MRHIRRVAELTGLAVVAFLVIVGVRIGIDAISSPADPPAPAGPVPASGPTGPLGLVVAPEDTGAHYDRDDWPTWAYLGDGCDRREQTLKDQGYDLVPGKGCKTPAGKWTDRYTGELLTDPHTIDIDHVVSAPATVAGRVSPGQNVGSITMTAGVIKVDTPPESTGDGVS